MIASILQWIFIAFIVFYVIHFLCKTYVHWLLNDKLLQLESRIRDLETIKRQDIELEQKDINHRIDLIETVLIERNIL